MKIKYVGGRNLKLCLNDETLKIEPSQILDFSEEQLKSVSTTMPGLFEKVKEKQVKVEKTKTKSKRKGGK